MGAVPKLVEGEIRIQCSLTYFLMHCDPRSEILWTPGPVKDSVLKAIYRVVV